MRLRRLGSRNENEREQLWRTLLPDRTVFGQETDIAPAFAVYELTGGNILNVTHRACIRAVSRGGKPVLMIEDIEFAIRAEIEKDGKVFKQLPLNIPDNANYTGALN